MSIRPAGYVCSNERIKKAQGDGQSIDLIGQAIKMTSAGPILGTLGSERTNLFIGLITNANEIFQDYVYTNNAIYGISHPP